MAFLRCLGQNACVFKKACHLYITASSIPLSWPLNSQNIPTDRLSWGLMAPLEKLGWVTQCWVAFWSSVEAWRLDEWMVFLLWMAAWVCVILQRDRSWTVRLFEGDARSASYYWDDAIVMLGKVCSRLNVLLVFTSEHFLSPNEWWL